VPVIGKERKEAGHPLRGTSHASVVVRRGRRSVDRGTRRPDIELRNQEKRDADAVKLCGRQHRAGLQSRVLFESCGVEGHVYAWKLLAREPGGPASAHRRWLDVPVGEG
jgi:hypothetical protein